ncbi:MAG TPA: hypothetical protein VM925_25040, partial [Labilithrix sp.]|nr:hypothetical protein [Labilithrix sp.]
ASTGRGALRLRRSETNRKQVSSRPVARTPLFRHRFFDKTSGATRPVDPDATYSMHLTGRLSGGGAPAIKLDFYAFDDSDPTEDPHSEIVSSTEVPITLPADGAWHDVDVPISAEQLGPNSVANMVLFYVRLGVPTDGVTTLDVDDIAVVEWRPASKSRGVFGAYGFVRNDGPIARDLVFRGLPAHLP